ncbi:hypothetical protein BAE44_0024907 [Dichanthelium oligosanthes]|uniref:Uncharacterized protein n=1 Tax=Dichanthelium oligosanthes TaxID=888268 RepID=A0A1E5UMJ3_9POAL|nr:hypothetical protein BAE44_0024907 [Dichanthelium oligosanthes]
MLFKAKPRHGTNIHTSALKLPTTTLPFHGAPQAANDGTLSSFLADKSAKVFIAGHKGMLGSAVHRRLTALGFTNVVGRTRAELDLTCEPAVRSSSTRSGPGT